MTPTLCTLCRTPPTADEVDDLIGLWHGGDGAGMTLAEYLGWREDEYAAWAECRACAIALRRPKVHPHPGVNR